MSTTETQQTPGPSITQNGNADMHINYVNCKPKESENELKTEPRENDVTCQDVAEKEEVPVCGVTVCGVTGEGEEMCVTVCSEGVGEGERKGEVVSTIANGKPSSATFPRRHRHTLNYSFSSTHSAGRGSPYGSGSSSSDLASLSQDTSFSASQQALDMQHIAEQLKQELLSQGSGQPQASGGMDAGELTRTLLEHVVTLKMELASVKEENEKMRHTRSNMDNELHELTENLFEEAYKMVDEAKGGKVSAEKRLADASGKIDAMETEMSTLKRLIHSSPKFPTSTPHTLHLPRSPAHKPRRPSIKRAVHKIQKRTGIGLPRSHSGSSKGSGSPLMVVEHKSDVKGECLVAGEIDEEEFTQFHHWVERLSSTLSPSTPSPSSTPSPTSPPPLAHHTYFSTIFDQDIRPCLTFKNKELSKRVLQAVQDNSVVMESLHPPTNRNGRPGHVRSSSTPPEGAYCALSEAKERECTHKMRLGEGKEWIYISQSCRDRVASVCDFFMYLDHIQKGIIKADTTKLFWQVARLRAMMQLSRYSLSLPADVPTR